MESKKRGQRGPDKKPRTITKERAGMNKPKQPYEPSRKLQTVTAGLLPSEIQQVGELYGHTRQGNADVSAAIRAAINLPHPHPVFLSENTPSSDATPADWIRFFKENFGGVQNEDGSVTIRISS